MVPHRTSDSTRSEPMAQALAGFVRTLPDYPKPGIMFRDLTTLMANPRAFRQLVDQMIAPFVGRRLDAVAAIEARGFMLGGAVAHQLGLAFIPLRKPGKLPAAVHQVSYELEYGTDRLEIHQDALEPGARVLLIDDLIATGGTAEAGVRLLRHIGAEVVGACFAIDLPELGGANRLRALKVPVTTIMAFEGH